MDNLKRLVLGDRADTAKRPKPIYPKIPEEDTEALRTEIRPPKQEMAWKVDLDYSDSQTVASSDDGSFLFTEDEIINGYRMSVILGEPLSKRGFRGGRK